MCHISLSKTNISNGEKEGNLKDDKYFFTLVCLFYACSIVNPYQKGSKWSQYALIPLRYASRCFKLWYKHGIIDTFVANMAIISQFWLKKVIENFYLREDTKIFQGPR